MGGSIRDQVDRVRGGIKRRSKHFVNPQRRFVLVHAGIPRRSASLEPLQSRIELESSDTGASAELWAATADVQDAFHRASA